MIDRRRFLDSHSARAGSVIVTCLCLVALLAPALAPRDPNDFSPDLGDSLRPPGPGFPLGADIYGRDILSRLLFGARVSLSVGLVAAGIATLIGTILGSVAGYYGGRVDGAIMRLADILLCFPTLMLVIAVVAVLRPGLHNVMAVIGLTGWPATARLVRGEFLALRTSAFAEAARAVGASDARIIIAHILPNAAGPLIVSATLSLASAILAEAGLSYLGLGVQPPTASWGGMLHEGQALIWRAWWVATFPGLAIFASVLGINLLGDGLRDAWDPRRRR